MLRATIKDLWARKIRLLATSAAVVLGVAFMCGTLVLTDTVGRTFDDLFANVNRGTDAVVRAEETVGGQFQDARPRIDESIVALVQGVDGVAIASGDIFQNGIQLVDKDGEPMGSPGTGAPTFGGVWLENELNPFTLREGKPPVGDDEAVIDAKSAKDGPFEVGDRATIVTPEPVEITIVGIATFGTLDSPGGASFVGMTQAAAQRWFGEPGKFDSVGIVAESGVSQEALRDRIAAVLPDGIEAITGAQLIEENQDDIAEGIGFFRGILLAFASIALFVGSFLIYNTFGIIVAQRTRELALLRALGASRRQVRQSVLVEATLVGVVASVVGLALGIGVAGLLKGLLNAVGMEIPAGGVVVTMSTVITALLTGIGIATTSAWFPARKASKVSPLAAMRDVAYEHTTASKPRIAAGLVILALAFAALAAGLFGDAGLAMVGLGAFGTFIGVSILGPLLARPITRVLGAPLPLLKGMTGVLARENAGRNPKRTASTAAALMIGVALVGFITVVASSATKSVNKIVDDRFTADVIIEAGRFGGGGLSPDLAAALAERPEVETVASLRFSDATIDGGSAGLLAVSRGIERLFDIDVLQGSFDDLDATTIALHEDWADDHGFAVGDTLAVQLVGGDGGEQRLRVAMIYGESVLAGPYFVTTDVFDLYARDRIDMQVFVMARDGVSADAISSAVEEVSAPYPNAQVADIAEYKESRAGEFQMMVNLIYGLLGLAIFIALLGIANTLALSIHERTRELGVLRAVGMTRSQVRSAIRWESVLIALLGTGLGLVIGLFFGWAMARAMRSEGFTEFSIPFGSLATICVIAAICGVLAAIWPARRASRLNILDAIAAA